MPSFTYTPKEREKAAMALAKSQGRDWEDLDEAERGNFEWDADAVLESVGGQED